MDFGKNFEEAAVPDRVGSMIATEEGLSFKRDGSVWRCYEYPKLVMYPGGVFSLVGGTETYVNAREALAAAAAGDASLSDPTATAVGTAGPPRSRPDAKRAGDFGTHEFHPRDHSR